MHKEAHAGERVVVINQHEIQRYFEKIMLLVKDHDIISAEARYVLGNLLLTRMKGRNRMETFLFDIFWMPIRLWEVCDSSERRDLGDQIMQTTLEYFFPLIDDEVALFYENAITTTLAGSEEEHSPDLKINRACIMAFQKALRTLKTAIPTPV